MQEFTILTRFSLFNNVEHKWMEVDVRRGQFNTHALKTVLYFMSDSGQIKSGTVDKLSVKFDVPSEVLMKSIQYAIATNQRFIDISRMRGNFDYTLGGVSEDNYMSEEKCAICKNYRHEVVLSNFNDLTEDYIHDDGVRKMWKGKNSTRAPPGLRKVRWLSDHNSLPSMEGRKVYISHGVEYKEFFHARQYMGHPHYHIFPSLEVIYIPETEAVLGIFGHVYLTFWVNLCSLVKMCEIYGDKKRLKCVNGRPMLILDAPTEMNIPTWEGFGEFIYPGSDLERKVKLLLKFHLTVIRKHKIPADTVRINRAEFDFDRIEEIVDNKEYTLYDLCNYHDYYAIKDLNEGPELYLDSLQDHFSIEENEVTLIITNDAGKRMGDRMFTDDTQIMVSSYIGFDSLGIPHFLNDIEEVQKRLAVPEGVNLLSTCVEFVEEKRTYAFNCEKITKRYLVWYRTDGTWTHADGGKNYFFSNISTVRPQLTYEARKLLNKITEAYIKTQRERVESFVFPESEHSEKLTPLKDLDAELAELNKRVDDLKVIPKNRNRGSRPGRKQNRKYNKKSKWQFKNS